MTGLDRPKLTLIHEDGRDMPSSWDGVPVEWREWVDEPLTTMRFHAPQSDTGCHKCGATGQRLWCVGKVKHADERRRRSWLVVRFTATRCRTCRIDVVWDSLHETEWELDASDYGPNGSN